MADVFRNTQFVNWFGEERPFYGKFVRATSLIPPTPTATPTPTKTPQPTPIIGLTSQTIIAVNDGNVTITGYTWQVDFNGNAYTSQTGTTKAEVRICGAWDVFPSIGELLSWQIYYPTGFTRAAGSWDNIVIEIDSFEGLILGNYRWSGRYTKTWEGADVSTGTATINYDPTPNTDNGCRLDILTNDDDFLVAVKPTPTPTATATNTPTLTRTPTNTPTPSLTPGLNKWKADLLSDSGCGSADLSGYTGNKIIVNGVESNLIPTSLGYRLNACLPQVPILGVGVVVSVKCELIDALEFCDVPTGFFYDELEWTITSSAGLNLWNADLDFKYLGVSQTTATDQINVDTYVDAECPRTLFAYSVNYPYFYAKPV